MKLWGQCRVDGVEAPQQHTQSQGRRRVAGVGRPKFDSPQAPADPKKVAAFFGKVKKRPYCCGCCGAPALPKNFPGRVWLKWIGEDKIFEDLPPRPPTYLVEKGRCYDCCSCFNCCCFCYASCITNFIARRETGDPSVDVDDESTLEAHGRLRRGRARLGRRRRSARAPVTALEATWARRCCCPYASTGPRVWIRPGKAGKPRTP